jgi:hypothetical protein
LQKALTFFLADKNPNGSGVHANSGKILFHFWTSISGGEMIAFPKKKLLVDIEDGNVLEKKNSKPLIIIFLVDANVDKKWGQRADGIADRSIYLTTFW